MGDADREIRSTDPGHYGAPGRGLTLAPATIAAAWHVQGDPLRAVFLAEVEQLFGVSLPLATNTTAHAGELHVFWLGPRSWLLVESTPTGDPVALIDLKAKRDVINGSGGAVFDVSASRVAYAVRGGRAQAILARCCPLDFDVRAFAPGGCAQSVLGRVAALFHRRARTDGFSVFIARSLAGDAWRALGVAAATDGYDVERAEPFDAG